MIFNQIVAGSGGGSGPAHYIEKSVSNGKLVGGSSFIDLTGVTDLGNYALAYAYYSDTSLTGTVDMSSLTQITGYGALLYAFTSSGITSLDLSNLTQCDQADGASYMCLSCPNLTTVNLSSLTDTYGFDYAFSSCASLTSANLSSVTSLCAPSMFYYCTALTSIDLHTATIIGNANMGVTATDMFSSCSNLATVDMSGVEEIVGYGASTMFYYCTSLTSMTWTSLEKLGYHSLYNTYAYSGIQTLSFPALTTFSADVDPDNDPDSDPFVNMLEGVDGCTVHFPAALQSTIANWPSVQAGFGGTNTTVLFDL